MAVSARTRHALMLALLFFAVSSPYTYKLVDSVVSPLIGWLVPQLSWALKVAEGGCPTTYGLLLHSAVFGLVAWHLHQ